MLSFICYWLAALLSVRCFIQETMKKKLMQNKQKPLKMNLGMYYWPLFLCGVSGGAQRKKHISSLGEWYAA